MQFTMLFVAALAMTALAFFAWRFLSRMTSARIRLTDSRFDYSDARMGANLRYGEIGVVKAVAGPYFGGWLTVHGSGRRIPIYLELEDITEFVRDLKTNLDAKHRQDAYRERELYGFLQWAKFTEVILRIVRRESMSLAVYTYVAGFLAYFVSYSEGMARPLWFLFGALYPWLVTACFALYVRKLVGRTAHRREFTVYDPDPIHLTRGWRRFKKGGILVFLGWMVLTAIF